MSDDFVRQLVMILGDTPRTAWEAKVRLIWGGERITIRRQAPAPESMQIAQLRAMGIPERTARWKVRGK